MHTFLSNVVAVVCGAILIACFLSFIRMWTIAVIATPVILLLVGVVWLFTG